MKLVVAGILRKNDRVLICQRSLKGSFPGKWEFPGGKVAPAETPVEGLHRELHEELAIEAAIGKELWRSEHRYAEHSAVSLIFYAVESYRGAEQNCVFHNMEWAAIESLSQFDFLEADLDLVRHIATGELSVPQTVQVD